MRVLIWIVAILGLMSCADSHDGKGDIMRGDFGGTDYDMGGAAPLAKAEGWSGSGTMTTGNTSTKVGAQADFKRPGSYTIKFGLNVIDTVPSGGGSFGVLRAIATIRQSVEGVTVIRKVSVQNGTSLVVTGSGVSVIVEDETTVVGVFHLGQRYKVDIAIAPGTRGTDEIPPILMADDPASGNIAHSLAPGSLLIAVPQNAGVKSVLVTVRSQGNIPIPEQAVQVLQLGANAKVLAGYDPRSMFFCPLVPGTVEIEIDNTTAADTLSVTVVFGIDG